MPPAIAVVALSLADARRTTCAVSRPRRSAQQRRLTKAEQAARDAALVSQGARDAETLDAKVDVLKDETDEIQRSNHSRFESLTGRVDRLEEKLSSVGASIQRHDV